MKKIVVLGPESTGKSTLCEQLAAHYGSSWVPEYARTYLEASRNSYTYTDLWEIARGQLEAEIKASNPDSGGGTQYGMPSISTGQPGAAVPDAFPLFIDTDLYVIKIWSEISFNKCDNRILTGIAKSDYDLYLLCNTDLPWTEDPLREYPSLAMRQKIYAFYKDAMINQAVPWVDISGKYEERLAKAIVAVDGIV
ncbi:MAG: ATPase [Chitinophagaceae bacterium]|nr:MAG: ATPase [Chitinophagaceae bacterium]